MFNFSLEQVLEITAAIQLITVLAMLGVSICVIIATKTRKIDTEEEINV